MENNTGNILTIDIGGSHIKATILNAEGVPISEYTRMPTPQPSTPINVIDLIKELVKNFTGYDKISVGFPGYIRNGVVKTAPNLGTENEPGCFAAKARKSCKRCGPAGCWYG